MNSNFIFVKNILKQRRNIAIIYTLLILIWYRGIFYTYFQSDEWHFFSVFLPYSRTWGGVLHAGIDIVIQNAKFTIPHATPLSIILWVASMKLFGLSVTPYLISSLMIHIFNAYLQYLFTYKLTKSTFISFVSGLFFALSANQYQSVAWIGTYLLTSLGVTFTLLALIFFLEHLSGKLSKWPFLIATIAGLMTKESTITIIPVCLLILLYTSILPRTFKKWGEWIKKTSQLHTLVAINAIYIPIRIGIIFLFEKQFKIFPTLDAKDSAFSPLIVIYRLITYPIKMFGDVFVPYPLVPAIVEFLTPLTYPYYGAEQSVRGTTFLLFTQSAGIDLLIYPVAIVIFFLCILIFWANHNSLYKRLLVIGLGIIAFASWPLIFVATFAPAAAYVAFFDSRHMYLPSIGAGLIVGFVGWHLWYRVNWFNIRTIGIWTFITIGVVWGIVQYITLQQSIGKYIEMGRDRRELTREIMQDVNKTNKSGIFYIRSNASYYGYGDLMPPFETNFGQILTVYLNQKRILSDEFLDTRYLTSKGLNGQGMRIVGQQAFGYFINFEKLLRAIQSSGLSTDSVYAYQWDGKNHAAVTITDSVRLELKEKLEVLAKYNKWRNFVLKDMQFSMKLPPDCLITESKNHDSKDTIYGYMLECPTFNYQLLFKKRIFHVGIFEDVSLMPNSDGELIGDNYYYRTIQMKGGESIIAKIPSRGSQTVYFLPSIMPEIIIEIHIQNSDVEPGYGDETLEEIISLMHYPIE